MTNLYTVHQVKLELVQLGRLGIPVRKAIKYVEANPLEISEYRENGMRISKIADLVRDLSSL